MKRILYSLAFLFAFVGVNAQLTSGDIAPNCTDEIGAFTQDGNDILIHYSDMRYVVGDTVGGYKAAVILAKGGRKVWVDEDILNLVTGGNSANLFAVTNAYTNKLYAISAHNVEQITEDDKGNVNIIVSSQLEYPYRERIQVKESMADLKTALFTCTGGGGGGGQSNTASNIGTGAGIFAQKSGIDLEYKSLVAGTGVTITPSADEITISASGGGGSSIVNYDANSANATVHIWATGTGVTVSEEGGGVLRFNIPTGVELVKSNVIFPASITNSSALYVQFAYADTKSYNTAAINLNIPVFRLENATSVTSPNRTAADFSDGGATSKTGKYGVSAFGNIGASGSTDLEMAINDAAQGSNTFLAIDFSIK